MDEKFASLEAEIASFCEEKGTLLGSTEKALDKWTGEIARVSQAAMDKANGAVAMLVSTIKTLKETEAQLSAAEEELDIAKTDLGKTGAELRATTQELLKTKANLEESRERTLALETSTAEMSSRLEATLATLATTTRDRDSERSGRLQANLAKAAFRMLKNKFHADAENAADALVDAEEALEAAKTSRAVAHVNAAQAKIRLALLRNGKLAGKPPLAATSPEGGAPPPFVSDAKIMEGTPDDLVPYQKMLAEEYHAASVALKTGQMVEKFVPAGHTFGLEDVCVKIKDQLQDLKGWGDVVVVDGEGAPAGDGAADADEALYQTFAGLTDKERFADLDAHTTALGEYLVNRPDLYEVTATKSKCWLSKGTEYSVSFAELVIE